MLIFIATHFDTLVITINSLKRISPHEWLNAIIISMISFWGLFFFTKLFQQSRYAMTLCLAPITSSGSILVGIFIFNEKFNFVIVAAMILVISALLYHQRKALANFNFSKEILITLAAAFFWGISFPFMLIPIKHFGVLFFSIILECCVFLCSYSIFIFYNKKITPNIGNNKNLVHYLILGTLVAIASFLSNFSLTKISITKNIAIGLLIEVLTLIVGINFFKEKLKIDDWILILLLTIAFCLLTFH